MNQNLECFNTNIVKWYKFNKTNRVMQIGKCKNITDYLEDVFKEVIVFSDIEKINYIEQEKFNYVILYGCENLDIKKLVLSNYLEDDGKFLLIGDNAFGLNNWSKFSNDSETGIQRLEDYSKKIKTIEEIRKELEKYNFEEVNTFYVFPDYRAAEVIINENFKIKMEDIEKYNPNINEGEIKIFDEAKIFKTIISNNPKMINFFANSYFIEVSLKKDSNDIKYISFNNCRKEQYQLLTIIKEDIVEKIAANKTANSHIENMKNIINKMKEKDINILDFEKNNRLYSKLIKNEKTLDRYLFDCSDNIDNIIKIMEEFKQILLKDSISYDECKNKLEYKENEEVLKTLHYLEKCYWDMVPKNCFYIDNKFLFFDQEWEKDYLPVEFMIYRSIINSYDLVRKINVDELFKKMDILKYKQYFYKIDKSLRKEVIDKEIYELMYKKENIKGIDNLQNDNKAYFNELNIKGEYIERLEKYVEDLKKDNNKKQEYIKILENNAAKKNKKVF